MVPISAAIAPAVGMVTHSSSGLPRSCGQRLYSSATVKAPTIAKAPCPSEIWPV
jgi:hypothetical protein